MDSSRGAEGADSPATLAKGAADGAAAVAPSVPYGQVVGRS